MPITVGCCLSLTGSFAPQGRQAEHGLRLWVEDINRAGGLLTGNRSGARPVALIVRDDGSSAKRAARMAEELIDTDRVDILVGPYGSAPTLAVAEVAERHGKVLWNHGGSSDALMQRGFRYTVNLPSPASRYFTCLLELTRTLSPALRRLFLVYGPTGTFAPAVIEGARTHARRNGYTVVGEAPYPADGNLGPLATEVEARRPDILLGAGRTESDAALAGALHATGTAVPIVGLVAAGVTRFGAELGTAAEGVFGPSQWEAGVERQPDAGPTATDFAERYRTRFRSEPDYPAAQAYAAGVVLQRCIEHAGTLQDDALRRAAGALHLRTLYGDFRLDPASGEQIGHALVIVQWQNGARRIVWPAAGAQAEPRFVR